MYVCVLYTEAGASLRGWSVAVTSHTARPVFSFFHLVIAARVNFFLFIFFLSFGKIYSVTRYRLVGSAFFTFSSFSPMYVHLTRCFLSLFFLFACL